MPGALEGSYLACAITQHIFKTVNTCSHVEEVRAAQAWTAHLAGGPGRVPPVHSSSLRPPSPQSQTPVGGAVVPAGAQARGRVLFLARALPSPLSHVPICPLPPPHLGACAHGDGVWLCPPWRGAWLRTLTFPNKPSRGTWLRVGFGNSRPCGLEGNSHDAWEHTRAAGGQTSSPRRLRFPCYTAGCFADSPAALSRRAQRRAYRAQGWVLRRWG